MLLLEYDNTKIQLHYLSDSFVRILKHEFRVMYVLGSSTNRQVDQLRHGYHGDVRISKFLLLHILFIT